MGIPAMLLDDAGHGGVDASGVDDVLVFAAGGVKCREHGLPRSRNLVDLMVVTAEPTQAGREPVRTLETRRPRQPRLMPFCGRSVQVHRVR